MYSVTTPGLWFSSLGMPCGMPLGCLDIFFSDSIFFYFNMRFSRYMLDWILSVIRKLKNLNPLITGKNQLLRTALPCWLRLTHPFRSYLQAAQVSPLSPPAKMCLFYLKHSCEWLCPVRSASRNKYYYQSGTHLLSHIVSNIVPSAAYVLTVVFGMGTGVPHKRIGTGCFWTFLSKIQQCPKPLLLLP